MAANALYPAIWAPVTALCDTPSRCSSMDCLAQHSASEPRVGLHRSPLRRRQPKSDLSSLRHELITSLQQAIPHRRHRLSLGVYKGSRFAAHDLLRADRRCRSVPDQSRSFPQSLQLGSSCLECSCFFLGQSYPFPTSARGETQRNESRPISRATRREPRASGISCSLACTNTSTPCVGEC